MDLFFSKAELYFNSEDAPSVAEFTYVIEGFPDALHRIKLAGQEVLESATDEQKAHYLRRIFPSALEVITNVWNADKELPREDAPYRQDDAFVLDANPPLDWLCHRFALL